MMANRPSGCFLNSASVACLPRSSTLPWANMATAFSISARDAGSGGNSGFLFASKTPAERGERSEKCPVRRNCGAIYVAAAVRTLKLFLVRADESLDGVTPTELADCRRVARNREGV